MNRSIFGVATQKWRFKVLRNCVLLITAFITFGQADAEILTTTPKPQGGDIVGSWKAEKVAMRAYVPAALVTAVKAQFSGESNGTLTLGADGKIQADYTTHSTINAVLLVPLSVSVPDTSRYEGNYTVTSDTHELNIMIENEDPLNYTYTATADSLQIIRPLLLEELLASLPESVRGLALGALSQHVPPDDPIKIVITFAKMKDTGTPTPPTPPTMLPGDFDGNGAVEFPDFLLFVAQFGKSSSDDGFDARMDLDGNGAVEFPDFLLFVAAFGSKSG